MIFNIFLKSSEPINKYKLIKEKVEEKHTIHEYEEDLKPSMRKFLNPFMEDLYKSGLVQKFNMFHRHFATIEKVFPEYREMFKRKGYILCMAYKHNSDVTKYTFRMAKEDRKDSLFDDNC